MTANLEECWRPLDIQLVEHVLTMDQPDEQKISNRILTFCSYLLPTRLFTALSYTWGNPSDTVPIVVNGAVQMITRNLRDALFTIRSKREPTKPITPVWADALCINQNNIAERSREVKRIRVVHKKASWLFIWLGAVPETWNFGGLKPSVDPRTIDSFLHNKAQNLEEDGAVTFSKYTQDELLSCIALSELPYWRRVWIFHEIHTADTARTTFFWGR